MAFFSRLSQSFWSFVSPRKQEAPSQTAATKRRESAPIAKKRGRGRPKKAVLDDVILRSKSMTPSTRVDSWRASSEEYGEGSSEVKSKKRKALMTPSRSGGHPEKKTKFEEQDDVDGTEFEGHDDYEDTINVHPTPSTNNQDLSSPYDELEGDTSVLVKSEQDLDTPSRKIRYLSPGQEAFERGISTEELRSQGWDDDHITLVHKIAMRGYEPLLPHHWKLPWQYMPDELFEADDDAFLTSLKGKMLLGSKALETLFGLGGWVRDREMLAGRITPEQQTRKMMRAYMKWADDDSNLDAKTALPLLLLECKPTHVPAAELQANAARKLAVLALRWRDALRARPSIEDSTESLPSPALTDPLPTLYAIIASGTVIALVAYNPNDAEPEVKSVGFFPMKDKAYDVWNSLALAITVCHLRNVRMRIAEETGVGLKGGE